MVPTVQGCGRDCQGQGVHVRAHAQGLREPPGALRGHVEVRGPAEGPHPVQPERAAALRAGPVYDQPPHESQPDSLPSRGPWYVFPPHVSDVSHLSVSCV